MDLQQYEEIEKKYPKHWAEKLETGDRCKATLRHKTDGTQNKHDVPVVVISVDKSKAMIFGHTEHGDFEIPFNELKRHIVTTF